MRPLDVFTILSLVIKVQYYTGTWWIFCWYIWLGFTFFPIVMSIWMGLNCEPYEQDAVYIHCCITIQTKSDIPIASVQCLRVFAHTYEGEERETIKGGRWLHLELMERSKKDQEKSPHYTIGRFCHYRMTHHIWKDRLVRGQKHRRSHNWWWGEKSRQNIICKSFKLGNANSLWDLGVSPSHLNLPLTLAADIYHKHFHFHYNRF